MARKGGIGGAKVLWRGFCRAKLSRREEPCRRRRARGADGREGRKRISYSHLPIHFSSINVLSSPFNSASCPGLAKSRRRGASRLLGSVNEFALATLRRGTEAIGLGVAVTNWDCALTRTSQRPSVTAHIPPRPPSPVTSAFLLGQNPA